MVCWFICYCSSDVTYYKTKHVTVCVHFCTLTVYWCYIRRGCVLVCLCISAYVCCSSVVCIVSVCVTDIIWCRLVSVLRLQAVSQRLIDKWIWFANVIKLIRKTAMGCWAAHLTTSIFLFFLSFCWEHLNTEWLSGFWLKNKTKTKLKVLKWLNLMKSNKLRLVRK